MLPDLEADISAAGQEVLELQGQHIDNILPSGINPGAVNGTSIIPLKKVPVTIKLGEITYVQGQMSHISRGTYFMEAAKGLGILSASYPCSDNQPDRDEQLNNNSHTPVICRLDRSTAAQQEKTW